MLTLMVYLRIKWIIPCIFCLALLPLQAQTDYYIEFLPGTAFIFPSELHIEQEGHPDLRFKAEYGEFSFKKPIYYSLRGGISLHPSLVLELEMNHLKVYLINKPPEIGRFSLSHGYNQFWLNLMKRTKHLDLRAGLGPVLVHPENTIRGLKWSENEGFLGNGYYIHGVTSQIGIQKRLYIAEYFYIEAEGKLNYSWTKTQVVNGSADLSLFVAHVLFGAGIKL